MLHHPPKWVPGPTYGQCHRHTTAAGEKVEADLCPLPSSLAAAPLRTLLNASPESLTQRRPGRQVLQIIAIRMEGEFKMPAVYKALTVNPSEYSCEWTDRRGANF